MILLGIETATYVCSVALLEDGRGLGESRLLEKNIHAEKLFVLMEQLCRDCRIPPQSIDAIAVSLGPGSFTGLRIGLSAAKGLVLAIDAALIGVSTLEALASQAPVSGVICPVIGARKGEVYCALYEKKECGVAVTHPPGVLRTQELGGLLPPGAYLLGPGLDMLSGEQKSALLDHVVIDASESSLPGALSVAQLGYRLIQRGKTDDPISLEPAYLQDFIAQRPK